jgi:hypothetical protein
LLKKLIILMYHIVVGDDTYGKKILFN